MAKGFILGELGSQVAALGLGRDWETAGEDKEVVSQASGQDQRPLRSQKGTCRAACAPKSPHHLKYGKSLLPGIKNSM